MSVLKGIEVMGNAAVSFEDAVKNVLKEASKTVKNITSVYVNDMQVAFDESQKEDFRQVPQPVHHGDFLFFSHFSECSEGYKRYC